MNQPAPRLLRGVGRWSLVALIINITIGGGIFGLPSKVYALVGSYSLLTYLICAALIGLIVLCFAEVGSHFTETGGSYLYVHAAFGATAGFVTGWAAPGRSRASRRRRGRGAAAPGAGLTSGLEAR